MYEFYATLSLPSVPSSAPTLALYSADGTLQPLPSGSTIAQCGTTAVYNISVPEMPSGFGGCLVIEADGTRYATVVSPRESEYADVLTSSRSDFDPAEDIVKAAFSAVAGNAQGAGNASGKLEITRFADWGNAWDPIPIDDTWEHIYFTIKSATAVDDASALLQLRTSNPPLAGDGIQVLNGQARGDIAELVALDTAVTFDVDGTSDQIEITLGALVTAATALTGQLVYDLKQIAPNGGVKPIDQGTVTYASTVTHAIE